MERRGEFVREIWLMVLWCVLIVLLLYASAYGGVPLAKNGLDTKAVVAEGSSSLLTTDNADEAKSQALEKAKLAAVMKVVSLSVDHELMTRERDRLGRVFEPHLGEIIGEYAVTSKGTDHEGQYKVKISAVVKESIVTDLLLKNLYDDRVVVITAEVNLGTPMKRHILEHELIREAKNKGYFIVDYRAVSNKTVKELVSSIRQGDTAAVKKLGLYYLTNSVIVGFVETSFSQKNGDIYSSHAAGQVKVHSVGDGREIASLTVHKVKGFGSDKEKSGIDAIKKASAKMAADALKKLPRKVISRITLTIREISSYASLNRAKEMLKDIPYVYQITEGVSDFRIEESTLYIKTTRGIDYVAGKISETKRFVIKKVGDAEILLESKKLL